MGPSIIVVGNKKIFSNEEIKVMVDDMEESFLITPSWGKAVYPYSACCVTMSNEKVSERRSFKPDGRQNKERVYVLLQEAAQIRVYGTPKYW